MFGVDQSMQHFVTRYRFTIQVALKRSHAMHVSGIHATIAMHPIVLLYEDEGADIPCLKCALCFLCLLQADRQAAHTATACWAGKLTW